MPQEFQPGDFLIFQLEAGYGLMRVLDVEGDGDDTVWHVAAYREFFLDVEMAEVAITEPGLHLEIPHVALTNRAFESTQVSKLGNAELTPEETAPLREWTRSEIGEVSDRSIRLLMGFR